MVSAKHVVIPGMSGGARKITFKPMQKKVHN